MEDMVKKKSANTPAHSTARPKKTVSMEEALATLIRRNEELVSLNKSKDEFIAITSHQLRTPATGVKQYIGLLLEGYAEPLTPSQRLFLEKAYENNERQLHIVDDILRIAQLDLEKIVLQVAPADIGQIVKDSVDSLESKFHSHEQSIKLIMPEGKVVVDVDAEQMRMVIENLLENASNYSPEGKKISVKLTKLKKGNVQISIKDEGVGISQVDLPKLFQKFSRIDNPLSNSVSGTGLGLYFSKKIVNMLGGEIKVKSSVEKGTTFIIILPPKIGNISHK